jgi:hypothetical protein
MHRGHHQNANLGMLSIEHSTTTFTSKLVGTFKNITTTFFSPATIE